MAAAKRRMNTSTLTDLTDFGDIELLAEEDGGDVSGMQGALHRHINQMDQQRKQARKRGANSGDADFIRDPDDVEDERRRQNDRASELMEEYKGMDETSGHPEFDEQQLDAAEDDFYKAAKASQKKKKKKRKDAYAKDPMMTAAMPTTDGKRKATRTILKNRGLTPHRRRENRNPRIATKRKYEKKMKNQGGQVRKLRKGEAHKYGGEMSGIRTDLVRSRKMK